MAACNLYSDYSVYDVAKLAVLLCRRGQLAPYWVAHVLPKLKQISLPAMIANSRFQYWTPPPEDTSLLRTRGNICWRCLSWEAAEQYWTLDICSKCYATSAIELAASGLAVPQTDVRSVWIALKLTFGLDMSKLRDLFYIATMCELQARQKRKLTS